MVNSDTFARINEQQDVTKNNDVNQNDYESQSPKLATRSKTPFDSPYRRKLDNCYRKKEKKVVGFLIDKNI